MTDEAWQNPKKDPSEREVAFDYVKSHDFRVVWADGAVGTLTPNGLVHFALYAERQAIPRRQVFEIVPVDETTGTLGKEVMEKQISRGSIVREMSCDVFLSTESVENLALWLLEQVARAEEMREQTK